MNIAVIALGKIGLPLAVQYASSGHNVVGVDINTPYVQTINRGKAPFPGEHLLEERLSEVLNSGFFTATTDYSSAIPQADVIVLVAPVFVDEDTWQPDFQFMDAATKSFSEHLSPDTLVIYETTLPVGTTRNRYVPMIEAVSGLRESRDFFVAYSPERVFTGRVFSDLRRYPKLIGAISDTGSRKAHEFYNAVIDFESRDDLPEPNGVWDLGSPEASELAKLAETTYRDLNIGFANELALFCQDQGIDVYKVISASNSQPYSHIHQPGIAVGGHCIPVYPRLYLSCDPDAEIVRTARLLNASMPERLVQKAEDMLGSLNKFKAVVLGASYRTGVKETAFSGVFSVVDALEKRGADVYVHDPMYSDHEISRFGWQPWHCGEPADLAIVQTNHLEYSKISSDDFPGIKLLIDGRNVSNPEQWQGTPRLVLGNGEKH